MEEIKNILLSQNLKDIIFAVVVFRMVIKIIDWLIRREDKLFKLKKIKESQISKENLRMLIKNEDNYQDALLSYHSALLEIIKNKDLDLNSRNLILEQIKENLQRINTANQSKIL